MKKVKEGELDFTIDLGLEGVKKPNPLRFDPNGEEELENIEDTIRMRRLQLKELEEKTRYYGGFRRYLHEYLNKTYHTLILVGFMFLGYTISGFKSVGLKIWKSPTSIAFYAIFTAGLTLLSIFEYARDKKAGGDHKE